MLADAAADAAAGAAASKASLSILLGAQKKMRSEQQTDVPDKDGKQPIMLAIGDKSLSASNHKGATWKQIATKVKEFERPDRSLSQQFQDMKAWLESEWPPQAKKPRTGGAQQTAAPALGLSLAAPGNWDDFAKMVASHMPSPSVPALQNGGAGDQLPSTWSKQLQDIQNGQDKLLDGQDKLLEMAVGQYIKDNEAAVRAAAIDKYSKAHRHDQEFVAEAQQAYAARHAPSIVAAAAKEYMEKHSNDDAFREEAVDAYIVKHRANAELKEAAAAKYADQHDDDEEFVQAAREHYASAHKDEILDRAAEMYKDEHDSDEEFIESAREKYVEENEKEILETAAEQYKEEHEEDPDFKEAAVRLKAEEL